MAGEGAAAALIQPSARTKARGKRSPLMGKFSTARAVCAPYKASAGTRISPMVSRSLRSGMPLFSPPARAPVGAETHAQRTRQGRLGSNRHPGSRYCMAAASSRAPSPSDK